jgi:hypothetical protein
MRLQDLWWRLSGPRKFLDEILEHLVSGRSVMLGIPPRAALGLEAELRAVIHDDTPLVWKWVDLGAPGEVTRLAAEALIPAERRPQRPRPSDIARDRELRSTVVAVNGIEVPQRFTEFASFLVLFLEEAVKHESSPRLVFRIPAESLGRTLPKIVGKRGAIVEWKDRMTPPDMLVYAASLRRGRAALGPTMLYERLIIELAGWDPELAGELATWEPVSLLEPWDGLAALANGRPRRDPTWEEGTMDGIGRRRIEHALSAVTRGAEAEISRRIWRAQLAEVFPWLEELRLEMVKAFRPEIRLPHDDGYGNRIENADDLELGHLYYNLSRLAKVKEERLKWLTLCRDIRHALAHQEPASAAQLLRLDRWWRDTH